MLRERREQKQQEARDEEHQIATGRLLPDHRRNPLSPARPSPFVAESAAAAGADHPIVIAGRAHVKVGVAGMSVVPVYSHTTYDLSTDRNHKRPVKGTLQAIWRAKGDIIDGTREMIDESLLNDSGFCIPTIPN